MIGHELGALAIGIIGLGNVGRAVASRLKAFGCRLIFTDVQTREFPGAVRVALETVLRESDIVCVHAPLDVDTRALRSVFVANPSAWSAKRSSPDSRMPQCAA
jgi:phosphoglycerate dehydrogenase-like enzyme